MFPVRLLRKMTVLPQGPLDGQSAYTRRWSNYSFLGVGKVNCGKFSKVINEISRILDEFESSMPNG